MEPRADFNHNKKGVSLHSGKHRIRGVEILYEDTEVIVVDKAAGVLTEETRRGERFTVENALNMHVRKGQSRSSKCVCVVHRLDRETSGVMVFAKTEAAGDYLKARWHDGVFKRYAVAVWGRPEPAAGTLRGYLYGDADLFVRNVAVENLATQPRTVQEIAKFAETDYETIASRRGMSLVVAKLHTGRRNQIRVQFSAAGHPVVGDPKYGASAPRFAERMCLHALTLEFPHPATGEAMRFTAPLPPVFSRLFGACAAALQ